MPETDHHAPRPRSLNALQHGCCAATPVLPGEDPALWQQLQQGWLDDYAPQTATSTRLVTEAALAFWHLARTRRQLEHVETALATKDPLAWTNEDHQTCSRFLRYHTTARRAFQSAFQSLEYLRKARFSEAEARRRAEERTEQLHHAFALAQAKLALAAQKQADAQHNKEQDRLLKRDLAQHKAQTQAQRKKKAAKFTTADQWIEVHIVDGVTQTKYYPSNDDLQDEIEDALRNGAPEPHLIYRRFHFVDGIPPEYAWTHQHDPATCETSQAGQYCELCVLPERGGYGLQRIPYEAWQQMIEHEEQTPGQHAGPSGEGNFPQPRERGGDFTFLELQQILAESESAEPPQPTDPPSDPQDPE